MNNLKPERLSVEYRYGVTLTSPVIPRRYTLTHSDVTGELFLSIGTDFAYDKLNQIRDEVLGEWSQSCYSYSYYIYLHIDDPIDSKKIIVRDTIFRRELSLALEAIRYGDRFLFRSYPALDHSPIIVHFISSNSQYNKIENWGTFSDYRLGNI